LLTVAVGSPPNSLTSAFVDTDNSQITGRVSVANRSKGDVTANARVVDRWSARRFGTSSPRTKDR
jgi:hypothetical protein